MEYLARHRSYIMYGALCCGCFAGIDLIVRCCLVLKRRKALPSPLASVRESTACVVKKAQHVTISSTAIMEVINLRLSVSKLQEICTPQAFDASIHLVDGSWRTVQYLFVVDALNFCFWPDQGLEYESLARGVKDYVAERGISAISADNLARMTGPVLRALFGKWTKEVPLEQERVRLLQEVGIVLKAKFHGKASYLVRCAKGSAVELVRLIVANFPGFRDQAVHNGRQVFLYKRAQIFVADVYGAFKGKGPGRFHDIDQLTMFADYRVPVVLHSMGILSYSPALKAAIAAKQRLEPGSSEEVELRAATIQAVEQLRDAIVKKYDGTVTPLSIHLDWWLWELGERSRSESAPHHRTLTIFY